MNTAQDMASDFDRVSFHLVCRHRLILMCFAVLCQVSLAPIHAAARTCPGGSYFDKHTGRTECCSELCDHVPLTGLQQECNNHCPDYRTSFQADLQAQSQPQPQPVMTHSGEDGTKQDVNVIAITTTIAGLLIIAGLIALAVYLKPTVYNIVCHFWRGTDVDGGNKHAAVRRNQQPEVELENGQAGERQNQPDEDAHPGQPLLAEEGGRAAGENERPQQQQQQQEEQQQQQQQLQQEQNNSEQGPRTPIQAVEDPRRSGRPVLETSLEGPVHIVHIVTNGS